MSIERFSPVAALAVAVLCASSALADTVVYDSDGFTSSRFNPGDVIGQDSGVKTWTGVQQSFSSGATTSANVQTAFAVSGSGQALRLDRTGNANGRFGPVINAAPAERFVNISWDMSVVPSTTTGFGPFFGVQFYGGNSINTDTVLGGFGVDAANGELIYLNGAGEIEAALVAPVVLNALTFNTFDILADFVNKTYAVFLNGNLVATPSFRNANVGTSTNFYAAPVIAIEAGGDPASLAAAGTAYVDNYFIGTLVPEPASLSLLGFAGLGLLRRSRR